MQTCPRSGRSLVRSLWSARDAAAEPAYWLHWRTCRDSEKQVKKRENLCLRHWIGTAFSFRNKKNQHFSSIWQLKCFCFLVRIAKQKLEVARNKGLISEVLPSKRLKEHSCYCCWQMLDRGKYNKGESWVTETSSIQLSAAVSGPRLANATCLPGMGLYMLLC